MHIGLIQLLELPVVDYIHILFGCRITWLFQSVVMCMHDVNLKSWSVWFL